MPSSTFSIAQLFEGAINRPGSAVERLRWLVTQTLEGLTEQPDMFMVVMQALVSDAVPIKARRPFGLLARPEIGCRRLSQKANRRMKDCWRSQAVGLGNGIQDWRSAMPLRVQCHRSPKRSLAPLLGGTGHCHVTLFLGSDERSSGTLRRWVRPLGWSFLDHGGQQYCQCGYRQVKHAQAHMYDQRGWSKSYS